MANGDVKKKSSDLGCDTIGQLSEGLFGRIVDAEFRRVANDMDERGTDGKPRKVVIEIIQQYDNETKRYVIKPVCKSTIPPQKGFATHASIEFDGVKRSHVTLFNPSSSEPDQTTIGDIEGVDRIEVTAGGKTAVIGK